MAVASPGTPDVVERQFVDLVLSDPELLDAEFEALIGANWPAVPRRLEPRWPSRRVQRRVTEQAMPSSVLPIPVRAQQRSPPPTKRQ